VTRQERKLRLVIAMSVTSALILYALFAFVIGEWNVTEWSRDTRAFMVFLWPVATLVMIYVEDAWI